MSPRKTATDGNARRPPLRIGMMADLYHPHLSGVTVHIDQLKQVLQEAGHRVWVFAFGPEQAADEARRIVRSPALPLGVRYGGDRLRFGARLSRPARRLLDSMDLVHAHHPFLSGWLGLRRASRRGLPLVFTSHTRYDLHLSALAPRLLDPLGQILVRNYLRWFCRRCSMVVSPCAAIRDRLRSWGVPGRFQIIPHGIDRARFAAGDRASRSQLGLAQGDKVLIFVGRLGREKELDVLLDAFETLASRHPGLRLLVVGDGPERPRLQRRTAQSQWADSIRFLGKRPRREVARLLRAADLFATPSRSEVCPISVIEAQAAGLPVIGFRAPGLNELVAEGESGLLAEGGWQFQAGISRLLDDDSLRREMGEQARVHSRRFDLKSMGVKILEAYRSLLSSRGSRAKVGGAARR